MKAHVLRHGYRDPSPMPSFKAILAVGMPVTENQHSLHQDQLVAFLVVVIQQLRVALVTSL